MTNGTMLASLAVLVMFLGVAMPPQQSAAADGVVSIQPEERVVISFEEQNIGIYIKIAAHLRRIGVHYRTLVSDPVLAREMLFSLPEKEVLVSRGFMVKYIERIRSPK